MKSIKNMYLGSKSAKWLELADLNLAAVIRSRMQAIPDATLLDQNGQMAFSIGRPFLDPHLNGIFRNGQDSNANIVESSNHFLQLLGYEFVIWIRDHADNNLEKSLHDAGLTPIRWPGSAGMMIEYPLATPEIPTDLEIVKISTRNETAEYQQVVAAAFAMPLEISQLAIGQLDQLTQSNVAAFIIREEHQAVAAGMVIVEEGVAGIYYIGTMPKARGRGLGKLCTIMATNAGFELGARAVILQASLSGEPLYQRLGYKTITHYRTYPIRAPIFA